MPQVGAHMSVQPAFEIQSTDKAGCSAVNQRKVMPVSMVIRTRRHRTERETPLQHRRRYPHGPSQTMRTRSLCLDMVQFVVKRTTSRSEGQHECSETEGDGATYGRCCGSGSIGARAPDGNHARRKAGRGYGAAQTQKN